MVHLIPDHGHPCDQCQNSARTKVHSGAHAQRRHDCQHVAAFLHLNPFHVWFQARKERGPEESCGSCSQGWKLSELCHVRFQGSNERGPGESYGDCSQGYLLRRINLLKIQPDFVNFC